MKMGPRPSDRGSFAAAFWCYHHRRSRGGILAPAGARRARCRGEVMVDALGLAAGTIAVANLVAAGPAVAAARTRPAALLRAE
jgi:hypothetical protein